MKVCVFIYLLIASQIIAFALTGIGYKLYTSAKSENIRPIILQWDNEGHKENMYKALDNAGIYPTDDQKRTIDTTVRQTRKKPVGFSNN